MDNKISTNKIIADIKATKGNRSGCQGLHSSLESDGYLTSICKWARATSPKRIDALVELIEKQETALISWEKTMMEVCGEDGPASVANEIRALQGLRDTAMQALKAQVEQLAAENLTMLRLLTDISENHVEYFSEGEDGMFAGVPLDYVSEINMYVSRDVNAENPFPATDAYLAGINAEALPANIAEIIDSGDLETICYESERSYAEDFRLAFYNFRQLREGAK